MKYLNVLATIAVLLLFQIASSLLEIASRQKQNPPVTVTGEVSVTNEPTRPLWTHEFGH